MEDPGPDREDTHAGTYEDIEAEVQRHFGGEWPRFLKALRNPGEVLHFVLTYKFDKDTKAFEAWAAEKQLPPDWVPRFYGMLDPNGDLPPPQEGPDRVEEGPPN